MLLGVRRLELGSCRWNLAWWLEGDVNGDYMRLKGHASCRWWKLMIVMRGFGSDEV